MKSSREKVSDIFLRKSTGTGAMWTGHLSGGAVQIYAEEWGLEADSEAIYSFLGDDCRWFFAEGNYKHPTCSQPFEKLADGNGNLVDVKGIFAHAESASEIDKYIFPEPGNFDFSELDVMIDAHVDKMVLSGMWCPFFHLVADMFGMENYFAKMYEEPEVVEALTERITDFYVEANDLFYKGPGSKVSTMFFGNDFGTQLDLLVSPDCFRRFVLPSFKRIIDVGKKHGKTIILHSCGSIHRVIPDLIEAGIDVLHPLQAQAAGMDAQNLAQYKSEIAFMGGIDAQSFFVKATPAQIKDEVRRVRDILGPNIVISPSHEEILPNIPAANILAMAEAARE